LVLGALLRYLRAPAVNKTEVKKPEAKMPAWLVVLVASLMFIFLP